MNVLNGNKRIRIVSQSYRTYVNRIERMAILLNVCETLKSLTVKCQRFDTIPISFKTLEIQFSSN